MRISWFAVVLVTALCAFGQSEQGAPPKANPPLGPLPKEPKEVFAASAALYDYSSLALKPWHLKVGYQVYDDQGQPGEPGSYERWWASPDTYRSTWKRGATEHTDWLVHGDRSYFETGPSPQFFEWKVQSAIFEPLPDPEDLMLHRVHYERDTKKLGDLKLPCIMTIPNMPQYNKMQNIPLGEFPTYCFDPTRPVLLAQYSYGGTAVIYSHIGRVQGRVIPTEFTIFDGGHRVLTAKVDGVNAISADAPELVPGPEFKAGGPIQHIDIAVAQGRLTKKVRPVYPEAAKQARAAGTVVLRVVIGRDGRIHAMQVMEAPDPSLAAAAMVAVRQWEYKPYLLNGNPVEVEATVHVVFQLGNPPN